jgi:hypothetical protein
MTFRMNKRQYATLPEAFNAKLDAMVAEHQRRMFPGMSDHEIGLRMSPDYSRIPPGAPMVPDRVGPHIVGYH